jgi:hypothetical protein
MDPRWVGAWWIPFLISGAAMFIIAIPILGYPKRLPGMCKSLTSIYFKWTRLASILEQSVINLGLIEMKIEIGQSTEKTLVKLHESGTAGWPRSILVTN